MITHTVDYSMVWDYTVDYGMVWDGLLHWGWAERAYQDVRTALPMGTDFQGSMLGNHSQTRDVNASSSFKDTQGNVKQTKPNRHKPHFSRSLLPSLCFFITFLKVFHTIIPNTYSSRVWFELFFTVVPF